MRDDGERMSAFRACSCLRRLPRSPPRRLRDAAGQSAAHGSQLEKGYTFQARLQKSELQEHRATNLVILAFSGGGTRAAAFSYGVLEFLRRTEAIGPKGNRVRLIDAVDVDHRRVGRQLHRAGLWPLWRQAVRRLRAAIPQARRAGRAPRSIGRSVQLGETVVDGLGPFRIGGRLLRRDPVQQRDVRRPQSRRRPVHHRVGDRHLDRRPDALQPEPVERHVRGLECGEAVPRRRRVVCRSGRALADHDQQLRRHLQLRDSGLGRSCLPEPRSAAARGARDTRAQGCRAVRRRRHIARTSTWWMAAFPTTWGCAACSTYWNCSRRCMARACRRRSTM